MNFKDWVPFFSRTGSEIANIMKKTGKLPARIYTNIPEDKAKEQINSWLYSNHRERIFFLPERPKVKDYLEAFGDDYIGTLITLHGWLRIIPKELCHYYIFNGHPGLITKYPELVGKDPQMRAYLGNYETGGSVLHRVVPEVDKGPILFEEEVEIKDLNLEETFAILADTSLSTWIKFFEAIQ